MASTNTEPRSNTPPQAVDFDSLPDEMFPLSTKDVAEQAGCSTNSVTYRVQRNPTLLPKRVRLTDRGTPGYWFMEDAPNIIREMMKTVDERRTESLVKAREARAKVRPVGASGGGVTVHSNALGRIEELQKRISEAQVVLRNLRLGLNALAKEVSRPVTVTISTAPPPAPAADDDGDE